MFFIILSHLPCNLNNSLSNGVVETHYLTHIKLLSLYLCLIVILKESHYITDFVTMILFVENVCSVDMRTILRIYAFFFFLRSLKDYI